MQFNEDLPKWEAVGSAPPESLQNTGFVAGYKPPAAFLIGCLTGYISQLKSLGARLMKSEE